MWYAWDTDGFLIGNDDNYKDFIAFKTKKDILWLASCNYEDGRKRPTVKRIDKGYYVYTPKDCDGNWREELTIIEDKEIDKYGFRELFEDLLKEFNNERN